MGKYTGKKAVATGGTIGMGLAVAKALLEGGAEVLLIPDCSVTRVQKSCGAFGKRSFA